MGTRANTSGLWFTWIFVLSLVTQQPIFGQSETRPADRDSLNEQGYPERLQSRSTFEKIVDFPGKLIFLPIKVVSLGAEGIASFSTESTLMKRLTSGTGPRGITPKFSSRGGVGIKFFQRDFLSRDAYLDLTLTAGLRGREMYRLRLKNLRLSGESLTSTFLVRYYFQPDESFFGIGPDSQLDSLSNFAHEQTSTELTLGTQFGKRIKTDALFRFDYNNIFKGRDESNPSTTDRFTKETLPGLETRVKIVGVQLKFDYDSRNHLGNPTSGEEVILSGGVFQQIDEDSFGFWKSSVELKRYIHLFHDRTLMFRVAAEMTDPLSDDRDIPFYNMSELGRWSTIRGFRRGRFRDRDLILGSIEYRYPIYHDGIDAMIFVDAGQVSPDIFEEFSTDDFQVGFGGGIRFWNDQSTFMSFEVGKSPEEFRFQFKLN